MAPKLNLKGARGASSRRSSNLYKANGRPSVWTPTTFSKPTTVEQHHTKRKLDRVMDNEEDIPDLAGSVSIRRRLKHCLAVSKTGLVLDLLISFFSLVSCFVYVLETYDILVEFQTQLELFFCTIFSADLLATLFLSDNWFKCLTDKNTLIDALSILPGLFVLTANDTLGNDFLTVFRFARVLRIIRILRVRRLVSYFQTEMEQATGEFIIVLVSIVFIFAGVFHKVENSYREQVYEPEITYLEAIYFLAVTLATVGYGDVTPLSYISKSGVAMFMLFFAYFLPKSTQKLIRLSKQVSKYKYTRYKPRYGTNHVVVCGDIRPAALSGFLQELLHPDHGRAHFNVVILAEQAPSAELDAVLRNPNISLFVKYVEGSPLSFEDLDRASVHTALSCFVLANKISANVDAMDAVTTLKALSIKRYSSYYRSNILLCLQLLNPANEHHVSPETSSMVTRDPVICVNEIKLNMLAKSCQCPGFMTMISNLIMSANAPEDSTGKQEATWLQEYQAGIELEVYRIKLAQSFSGLHFVKASTIIYKTHGTLMVALEIRSPDSQPKEESLILMSPGKFRIPNTELFPVYAYVIASDYSEAEELVSDSQVKPLIDNSRGMKKRRSGKVYPLAELHTSIIDQNLDDAAQPAETKDLPVEQLAQQDGSTPYVSAGKSDVRVRLEDVMVSTSVRQDFPSVKGHIVVMGNIENLYYFIKPLREKYLGNFLLRAIVILHDSRPSPSLWNKLSMYDLIFFVQGSGLEPYDLERAGISFASTAVVLTKSSVEQTNLPETYVNSDAIFTFQCIKRLNSRIPVLVEVTDGRSIDFLQKSNLSSVRSVGTATKGLANFDNYWSSSLYASGQVHVSTIADKLVSQSFYNPHIVSFVKLLNTGSVYELGESKLRNKFDQVHPSNVYQIPVPKSLQFKTYGDAFDFLVNRFDIIPMGIYRGIDTKVGRGELGNTAPYVVTNPSAETTMYPEDKIYILSQRVPSLELQSLAWTDVIREFKDLENMKDRLRSNSVGTQESSKASQIDEVDVEGMATKLASLKRRISRDLRESGQL